MNSIRFDVILSGGSVSAVAAAKLFRILRDTAGQRLLAVFYQAGVLGVDGLPTLEVDTPCTLILDTSDPAL